MGVGVEQRLVGAPAARVVEHRGVEPPAHRARVVDGVAQHLQRRAVATGGGGDRRAPGRPDPARDRRRSPSPRRAGCRPRGRRRPRRPPARRPDRSSPGGGGSRRAPSPRGPRPRPPSARRRRGGRARTSLEQRAQAVGLDPAARGDVHQVLVAHELGRGARPRSRAPARPPGPAPRCWPGRRRRRPGRAGSAGTASPRRRPRPAGRGRSRATSAGSCPGGRSATATSRSCSRSHR